VTSFTRPATDSFCDVNGTRTAYRVVGKGPALLLIHGGGGDHHVFDAFADALSSDTTVIMYTQRDCGRTENSTAECSLPQLAADAAELIRVLGFGSLDVFGTSFGGRIAQVMALSHPGVIDRLVLNSTWPITLRLQDVNPIAQERMKALKLGLPNTARALAAYYVDEGFLDKNSYLIDIFTQTASPPERLARRTRTVGSIFACDLAQIQASTLVVAGERDRIVPPCVTVQMADTIPRAKSVLMNDVGHVAQLQAPRELAGHILSFLIPRA
jgi:pimeloyl-ACP methyl ester carboxylesterase